MKKIDEITIIGPGLIGSSLGLALKSKKTPSILSLTRQNLQPIRKKYSNTNMCSLGAYEVMRTNKKISLTILASGSEVNLAIETSHKLAKDRIYSKVISMPCFNLFDKQSKTYRCPYLLQGFQKRYFEKN